MHSCQCKSGTAHCEYRMISALCNLCFSTNRLTLNPVPATWLFSCIWGWTHYPHPKLAKVSVHDSHHFPLLQKHMGYSCGNPSTRYRRSSGFECMLSSRKNSRWKHLAGKKELKHNFFARGCNPSVMAPGWAQGSCENEQEWTTFEVPNLMSGGEWVHPVEFFRWNTLLVLKDMLKAYMCLQLCYICLHDQVSACLKWSSTW